MSGESEHNYTREEVLAMMDDRKAKEAELSAWISVLESQNVGMDDALVDNENYPSKLLTRPISLIFHLIFRYNIILSPLCVCVQNPNELGTFFNERLIILHVHYTFLNEPFLASSLFIFVVFKQFLHIKIADFSWIRRQILLAEGKHADYLTSTNTTAQSQRVNIAFNIIFKQM